MIMSTMIGSVVIKCQFGRKNLWWPAKSAGVVTDIKSIFKWIEAENGIGSSYGASFKLVCFTLSVLNEILWIIPVTLLCVGMKRPNNSCCAVRSCLETGLAPSASGSRVFVPMTGENSLGLCRAVDEKTAIACFCVAMATGANETIHLFQQLKFL